MMRIEWRRIARTATRAEQSAAAYALLSDMLRAAGLPTEPVQRTASGRPYLAGYPHVDFNLSHTKGLVVAVLSTVHENESATRVGVDVESKQAISSDRATRLAERFFAPCELAFFRRQADPVHAFATVFTRKEAFAKYCGDGLAVHLRATDTMAPDFETVARVCFTAPDAPDGYCITLCTEA